MEENNKRYRIGWGAATLLLIIALVFDGLTLIPFVGDAVAWVYWIPAAIYFWRAGLGFANWKIWVPELLSFVAEIIPAVQELPTIVVATFAIIVISRIEDRTGISVNPVKTLTPSRMIKRQPLNKDGVRKPSSGSDLADEIEEENEIVKAKFKDDLEDLDMAA